MATLTFDGTDDRININPLSTSLNNLANGAATVAMLLRRESTATNDHCFGLRGGNMSGGYYHGVQHLTASTYNDDNGTLICTYGGPVHPTGSGGSNFHIFCTDWPATDALQRIHVSGAIGSAESWAHADSDNTKGSNLSGPGTGTGYFHVGNYDGAPWLGDVALLAVWVGTRFTDTDALALWVDKKTSDWYNHAAGIPDTLIEFNTSSPTDIGSDPVSSIALSGPTLSGADPTGWTFDGQGITSQTVLPDADVTTTGWTTTPLFSKINDASDATVITATAS